MWTREQTAEFITRINVKRETYDKPPLSDQAMKLEISDLEHLSFDEVVQAMKEHRDQYKPPNAASILLALQPSETDAVQAWQKVIKAYGPVGQFKTPVFDDPRIPYAMISVLGQNAWADLGCMEDPYKIEQTRKDFLKAYVKAPVSPSNEFCLIGRHDLSNTDAIDSQGRVLSNAERITGKNTMLVGDEPKARALLSHIEQVKLLEGK